MDAAEGGYSPGGMFIWPLIVWAICHSNRHRQCGGWLMYYYLHIYCSSLVTIVILAAGWDNVVYAVNPANWEGIFDYITFMAATYPALVLWWAIFIWAHILFWRREAGVWRIHLSLHAGYAVAMALSVAHDAYIGNPAIVLTLYSALVAVFWVIYFYRSKRVEEVFITHTFDPKAWGKKP